MAEEILLFLSKDGGPHKLARSLPALPAGTEVCILSCRLERKGGEDAPIQKAGFIQRLRKRLFRWRAESSGGVDGNG